MRRSDETPRRAVQEGRGRRASLDPDRQIGGDPTAVAATAAPPSKTRRKAEMHDRQDLGEALLRLPAPELATLDLPERLAEAIEQMRNTRSHEGRRRQLQFIGRLMREVDPGPIRDRLARCMLAPAAERARLAAVERWRRRLLAEPGALDSLCAAEPGADRSLLAMLIARTVDERARERAPRAYRELFRTLNALFTAG